MQEYTLRALDDFHCLGSDCPNTCCQGWNIDVDEVTIEKWQSLPDSSFKSFLLDKIKREKTGDDTRSVLSLNDNNHCVHLDSNNLCSIQTQLGHGYLPRICRDYPRIKVQSEKRRLMSAVLSCPETARLVLFGSAKNPLFLPRQPTGNEELDPTILPATSDKISQSLETLLQGVLEQKKYPINVRVTYLANLLSDLADPSASSSVNQSLLVRLHKEVKSGLYNLNLAIKRGTIQPDGATAGAFWRNMYRFGVNDVVSGSNENWKTSPLFQALAPEVHQGEHQTLAIYEALRQQRRLHRNAIRFYNDAFENILSVSLMNRGFPWGPIDNNYILAFLLAMFPFAIAQLYLLFHTHANSSLTEQMVTDTAYKAARAIDHKTNLYRQIYQATDYAYLNRHRLCFLDIY